MASLLIVDDHAAVRAGLAALVAPEPALHVVASAADADAAMEAVDEHAPDIALVDVHLPGEDGLSLCLRLDGPPPRPRRVLYSAFADDLLGVLGAVAGADALVPKDADPDELLDALRAIAGGAGPLLRPDPAALRTVSAALDPEDLPILAMLVHDTPAAEIAATLGLDAEALLARRWAMLRRLRGRRHSGFRHPAATP